MSVCRVAALLFTVGLLAGAVSGATAATRQSFTPSAVTAAGTHVVAFSVGDFNADGKPDLAVANQAYHSKTAAVLLGRGDGAFGQPSAPVKLSETPDRIMTADVNGDGNLDAVLRINDEPAFHAEHVSILLGNGAGALRPAPGSPIDFPDLAAIADVNGDHKPDLVGFGDNGERIAVGLGDGTGHFVATRSPSAGSRVAVADFNGDGLPDLVVGRQKNLSTLLGIGSGRFAAARKIGWAEGGLIVTDFNGDGKLDLAVAGKTFAILLGNGAGSFSRAPGSPVKGNFRGGVTTADVNADGKIDIAAGQYESVVTLLGDGTGRFHRAVGSQRLPFDPTLVAAADLNGDGKVDIAARTVLYGDGYDEYVNVAEEGENGIAILANAASMRRPSVSKGRIPARVKDAQLSVRGAITRLAADRNRAAVLVSVGEGHCTLGSRVVVWKTSGRTAVNVGPLPAPECAGDCCQDESSVDELALGGDTVAWITSTEAGNTEGWHDVFAAKLPSGTVKRIAHVSGRAEYDGIGSWTGHLLGEGSLLAYNEWGTECDAPPGELCYPGAIGIQVGGTSLVRIGGARRFALKRGADSYRLSAVGGERMAVESPDGRLTILARNGRRVATVPTNGDLPLSVALSSTHLAVVRWSHVLDLYNPRTGRKMRSLPLAVATPTSLGGVNARVALLRRSGLVLVRLRDGRSISLRLPPHVVGASLTERGLFYAYNKAHEGHIVFEPNATLLRRF